MVKKSINAIACALIAPLAFAQTSTTRAEPTAATQPMTATKTASVLVTTYEPGKVIVVASKDAHDSVSYMLDKTVRYVNKFGKEIDEGQIKPGTRIHVYYDETGETPVVNRVVVDDE